MADINLPATQKWPVSVTNLPQSEPLVICPHDGPVVVTLDEIGEVGKIRTVKCSERAKAHVAIGRVKIRPGEEASFRAKRKWWSAIVGGRPRLRWVYIG